MKVAGWDSNAKGSRAIFLIKNLSASTSKFQILSLTTFFSKTLFMARLEGSNEKSSYNYEVFHSMLFP